MTGQAKYMEWYTVRMSTTTGTAELNQERIDKFAEVELKQIAPLKK